MGLLTIAVGVVCLLGCVQSYNEDILDMYVNKFTGKAVYYGRSQDGSCQFGPELPPVAASSYIRHLVGINAKQYAGSISCGMCLRVRGTGEGEGQDPITGDFVVFVNNLCGDCEEGGIDLAADGDGQWTVEIEAIQCPVDGGTIEYRFQGSDEWYLRLQVRNTRVPVQVVHILRNGVEEPMKRTSDGFWEFADGQVRAPIQIKMTAVTDEVIEDVIPSLENEIIQQGETGAQFAFDWELPGK